MRMSWPSELDLLDQSLTQLRETLQMQRGRGAALEQIPIHLDRVNLLVIYKLEHLTPTN